MIRRNPLKSAMLLCLGAVALTGALSAAESVLSIASLEPTALITNSAPLSQIATLAVTNAADKAVSARVQVVIKGVDAPGPLLIEFPAGVSEHSIYIPEIRSSATLHVELQDPASRAKLASHQTEWQPQRRWKVYLTLSSHEDLGYENFIQMKQEEIASFIDLAKDLARTSGPEERNKYRYTLETLIFMRNYIEEKSLSAWRDLVEKDVKTGALPLAGAPSGVHTHWMDYEELARMNYWGRREAKDRFGLDLKTYLMVDNSSVSWSAAQAIADAGFSYIARYGQPWRTGGNNNFETTKLPAIFYWVGPDTRTKILFAWRSHYGRQASWYGQRSGKHLKMDGDAPSSLSSYLKSIESGQLLGPYPYDAVLNPQYSDHEKPAFEKEALEQWHAKYRYPEILIEDPTRFFQYIEKHYAGNIPSLSGDLNNFSADYAAIDPESQGWKRKAARLLPFAEGLAAVAGLNDAALGALGSSFDAAYLQLMDYDEHSWPTLPRPNDFHVFNSQWVKNHGGRRSLEQAESLLETTFNALLKQVPNPAGNRILVFNPMAHERTDLIEVQAENVQVFDLGTGEDLPSQPGENKTTLFLAKEIPAFGYRTFGMRSNIAAKPPAYSKVAADTLENEFYRIKFTAKGTISSILDKEFNRELVNPELGYDFNQLVHVRKQQRESREGVNHSPESATLRPGIAGPLMSSLAAEIDDPKTGAKITQNIILYNGVKRFDVVNDLKHVRALFSTNWGDRYEDNLFYAFPLALDHCEFHVEYPGGVVRPYDDQLRWGSHDYLYANRWVNAGNQTFSITMAPWEAGTVHFGEIRYNEFSIDYKPELPVLFSYPYANRMAGLIPLSPSECNATLRYSFTSHKGGWRSGATQFGWRVASPLQARVLPLNKKGDLPERSMSIARVDQPNVQLVNLKHSELPGRGWIIRLVETEGKDTPVTLTVQGFPVGAAVRCNLVEDDVEALPVKDHEVKVTVPRFSMATLRLIPQEPAPVEIIKPRAEPVSDQSIRVKWAASGKRSFAYSIFRSTDPRDPPTIHTLIGRATGTEYTDEGLSLDTTYYYQVAPVSRYNRQGPVSPLVSARTSRTNISPPTIVRGLGVVRRSTDLLIIYWRKNPEPDVRRYHLYRSLDGEFDMASAPLATVEATPQFLQIFRDESVTPSTRYFYRVIAEDTAGNRQTESPVASARTPDPLTENDLAVQNR